MRGIEEILEKSVDYWNLEKAQILVVLLAKYLNKENFSRKEAHKLISNAMEHPLALVP